MEHQWSVSCCERYHFSVIHQMQGLDVANTGGKKTHKQGQNMLSRTVWELENKRVTCLSRASSLLLFAFLLCFQFSKFSHLNLSSFILQSPRNASVTMQLLCRYTHEYEKNAGVRHLLSPLRLTLIVRRRGDFLCFKGEVSLEVKTEMVTFAS